MSSPQSSSPLRIVKLPGVRDFARDAVAAFRLREHLAAARESVGCVAVEHGHTLGPWRVEGAETFALVQCRQCGNGARLELGTAAVLMTGLHDRCAGMVVAGGGR